MAGIMYFVNDYHKQKQLAQLVERKTKEINITSIRDYDGIWIKHIVDSLKVSEVVLVHKLLSSGVSVLDLGTGGGFPGLPLAINYPNSNFTLLDSKKKKISVVEEFIKTLGLKNASAVWGRAEELKAYNGVFDVLVSRAVSYLPNLIEISLPKVKKGGILVFWKSNTKKELDAVNNTSIKLVGKYEYSLENKNSRDRVILVYKRIV